MLGRLLGKQHAASAFTGNGDGAIFLEHCCAAEVVGHPLHSDDSAAARHGR
jgi:hypothetical protein